MGPHWLGVESVEACDEATAVIAEEAGDTADDVNVDWAALREDSAAAAADTAGAMEDVADAEDSDEAARGATLDDGCVVRA